MAANNRFLFSFFAFSTLAQTVDTEDKAIRLGKGKQRLHQQLSVTSKVVTGVLPIHISRLAGGFGMRMLMSKHYPWTTVARVLLGERHKSSSWVTHWRSAQPWSAWSRVCCVSLYPQTKKSSANLSLIKVAVQRTYYSHSLGLSENIQSLPFRRSGLQKQPQRCALLSPAFTKASAASAPWRTPSATDRISTKDSTSVWPQSVL